MQIAKIDESPNRGLLSKIFSASAVGGPYPPDSKVCYEFVGCFNNSYPFDNAAYFLPIDPSIAQTEFFLYTQKNPKNPEMLSYKNELSESTNYDPRYPLKIFIHGFTDTGLKRWTNYTRNAILEQVSLDAFLKRESVLTLNFFKQIQLSL